MKPDTKSTSPGAPATPSISSNGSSPMDHAELAPPSTKKPTGRPPGRPPGSKTKPAMPDKAKGQPSDRHGNEKPPDLLTDGSRAAAIRREAARLDELIAKEKQVNPAAAHWRKTETLFSDKGHGVEQSAWRPFVALPVRLAERLAGVEDAAPRPSRVTDEEIDGAAKHWEKASVHLGLSESGAAWLGAVGATMGTVGLAVGRALSSWWEKRKTADEDLPTPSAPTPPAKPKADP